MRVRRPNRLYSVALWIDRYMGSVLCALLLGWKKAVRVRRAVLPPGDVEKVLLLKMWGMGSIVLTSPLLEAVRESYPRARVDFLSLTENRAIVEMYSGIERTFTIDLRRGVLAFLIETARTIAKIRRERYDLLLDLEFFTRFSAVFSFLANPRCSHGFSAKGKWRGKLHDVEVPFNAYNHVALNFLDLLRGDPMDPVGADSVSGPESLPLLAPPQASWQSCRRRLSEHPAWREGDPIAVVNPNAGDMALERRWPAVQVAQLLRRLCDREGVNVVTIGSPAESAYVESVVEASGAASRIANLAGKIDIGELVGLLAHAAVVVTNDSGPLHIAAAAGASTVALFGPETPTLYGPLRSRPGQRHVVHYLKLACSPCMFVHDNKVLSCWFAQARCMTGIGPADVLASVEALLAEAVGDPARAPQLRVIDT